MSSDSNDSKLLCVKRHQMEYFKNLNTSGVSSLNRSQRVMICFLVMGVEINVSIRHDSGKSRLYKVRAEKHWEQWSKGGVIGWWSLNSRSSSVMFITWRFCERRSSKFFSSMRSATSISSIYSARFRWDELHICFCVPAVARSNLDIESAPTRYEAPEILLLVAPTTSPRWFYPSKRVKIAWQKK